MKQTARSFAGKSCLITLAITTVLCTIIFSFMTQTGAALPDMTLDVTLTAALTGLITAVLMVLTSKGTAKKEDTPVLDNLSEQACYFLIPENFAGYIIGVTILDLIIFGLAPIGAIYVCAPGLMLPRFAYIVFKALVAGCAASFASYHANLMVIYLYKKKLAQ